MDSKKLGETSKKKNSECTENDRPLKKARYLWQVKGKYHLKENTESMDSPKQEENNKEIENNKVMTCNNNLAQSGNKNICSDRSCIEALIANSDKIMVMDFPEPESPPKNIDKSISDEIPITLVKPSPRNEDYYLRKWQARQIAKGFVDNTINRVLESWMIAPFDAADFVENCDNGGQIEDEGILMAIQSHGLHGIPQRNIQQSGSRIDHCRLNTNSCTCAKTRTESNMNLIPPFHRRAENDFSVEYYENLCILKDNEDKPEFSSAMDHELNDNSSFDPMKMNDTEFLDAAVTAAIQKKGLTSYNCVDCG